MVVTDKVVYYQKVYANEKRYFVNLWAMVLSATQY